MRRNHSARIRQIWQQRAALAAAGEMNCKCVRRTNLIEGGWGPRGVQGFSSFNLGIEGSFEVSSEDENHLRDRLGQLLGR